MFLPSALVTFFMISQIPRDLKAMRREKDWHGAVAAITVNRSQHLPLGTSLCIAD